MNTKIVVSGVNMTEGGILTILKEVLFELEKWHFLDVTVLVHSYDLFSEFKDVKHFTFLEFRKIKKSWISRIWFEWVSAKFICNNIKPNVWLSLHDMSVNVSANKTFVYCHNPSPFYKTNLKDFLMDKKFFLFTIFYKLLYSINIKKNKSVIVQQTWIADEFSKMYGIDNIIVARPVYSHKENLVSDKSKRQDGDKVIKIIYPAIPRVFKNFEVVLDAVDFIKKNHPDVYQKFEIQLTFDLGKNRYGDHIFNESKTRELDAINFIGYKDKIELDYLYKNSDALIFPSKLETWGLPLTEAKSYGLPVICVDLPYSRETLGEYDKCNFFPADDYEKLARTIIDFIHDEAKFVKNEYIADNKWPVYSGWSELIKYVVSDE